MKTRKGVLPLMAAFILGFSSCSKDDGPAYSATVLKNTELMTVLKSKGYIFNQEGKLELNDKVNSTVSLDLSGTKIADFTGLDILPNLKEVKLSDNGYGPSFDFAKLPKQITGIDLTGNDIYDFENLVDVKIENEERKVSVLHTIEKFYLPNTARYNIEDLLPFYEHVGKNIDMKIADKTGKMQEYNTIRELPDPIFVNYMKKVYPSMFSDNNHIDFSKQPVLAEQGRGIVLFLPNEIKDLKSIEGIEYFINNPYLKTFNVVVMGKNPFKIGHVSPRGNITALILEDTEISDGIDLSKAEKLSNLTISRSPQIKVLDLSNTRICNMDVSEINLMNNSLRVKHCPNLETIIFPRPSTDCMEEVFLGDLPKLKKLDLSMITALEGLYLFLDNTEIKFPLLKNVYSSSQGKKLDLTTDREKIFLSVSQKVIAMSAFKDFKEKYGLYCMEPFAPKLKEEFGAASWK